MTSGKPKKTFRYNEDAVTWDRIAVDNRLREIEREIAKHEKKSNALALKNDREYERLERMQDKLPWTPEGREQRSKLRLKQKAISRKYHGLMAREREALRKLKNERRALNRDSGRSAGY